MSHILNLLCLWSALTGSGQAPAPAIPQVSAEVRSQFDVRLAPDARYTLVNRRVMDGFELRDIRYASPHGGTVTAFVLVPAGKGPFPLVVYGHWGNGTRASFLPEAMVLARAGVASFIADAPFARELGSFKSMGGAETRDVYVQAAVDTRLGLSLMEREPFVDRERVAYAGLSFGAQIGAILAGVDKRFKAVVVMGGLPSLARQIEHGQQPYAVRLREGIKDKEAFLRFISRLAEIDSERFIAAEHPPILFQFGTYDAAIPEAAAKQFAERASAPKDVRWYLVGHDFNDLESLNDRLAFLAEHLGFTAPCVSVAAACESAKKD